VALALDHYGTTPTYLAAIRDLAINAARHVAGELEEVPELTIDPDTPGDVTVADLLEEPIEPLPSDEKVGGSETTENIDTESDSAAENTQSSDTASSDDEMVLSSETTADSKDSDDPGDFEPGEFDLDEDEREQVKEEYGTEFQSASDVDGPGQADIDTPDPKSIDIDDTQTEGDRPDSTDGKADSPSEDEDLVDIVIETMEELDEGEVQRRGGEARFIKSEIEIRKMHKVDSNL
jgi:hypothetical protein